MRKYIFILLLELFSNLSFAKDWKIIDEQMVPNTCIFEQYEDYLVTKEEYLKILWYNYKY